MANLEIEKQKALEADEREREEQRQYAVKTITDMHRQYLTSGSRGRRDLKAMKERIDTLITKDPGGVWYAGELLKQQSIREHEPSPKCAFRFETELFQHFIDVVAEQAEELKAYDEPTYNDDVANAALLKEFLAAKEGKADVSVQDRA